jgi:hypothetical protein
MPSSVLSLGDFSVFRNIYRLKYGFNVEVHRRGSMPLEEKLLPLNPLGLMPEGLLPWNKMSLKKKSRPLRVAG